MSVPYWGADQTGDWDPNWASTLALFFASSLSEGITGRQLSLVPGNHVREIYVAEHGLSNDQNWTPQTLASRIHELLHEEPVTAGLRKPPLLDTETTQSVSR